MKDIALGLLALGVFVFIVNTLYNWYKGYKTFDFRIPSNRTVNPSGGTPPNRPNGKTVNPSGGTPPDKPNG
jgi:hypothetical protein